MLFSEKLQLLRKTKGMTQEELAELLRVSRQAISKWESGISYPDILNLIELSNLFHVTIDFLVKNEPCSVSLKQKAEVDLEELVEFRIEASRNTYAGYGTECQPSRVNSHDYCYEKGEYLYYDTWLGGEKFSGEEAVWKKGTAVYSMNYFGRTLDERFSGDFLKEVLRAVTKELPFRGPEFYQSGEYLYKTRVIGDVHLFQGYEEIYWNDIKVYECFYHGGLL